MPHLAISQPVAWALLAVIALLGAFFLGFKAGQENEGSRWRAAAGRRREMEKRMS